MSLILDGGNGITFPNGSNAQAAPSKVLQVVNASYSTSTSTTSSSFVSTGLSATITPLFSTSKIMIIASTSAQNSSSANGVIFTLFRGTVSGTNLGGGSEGFGNFGNNSSAIYAPYAINYVDSPATTSATTYTVGFLARSGTTAYAQNGNAVGSITLLEIAQ